jgi:cell division protein FtsQ
MAARRNNRRRHRRGRFGFLYKLLSVCLILAAILAGCVVFFKVEEVAVSGQNKYTADEIIQASGIRRGDNLFLLNKVQTYRKILSALPYVDQVSLRRGLPNTVIIAVSECTPAVCLEWEGSWWILDAKGKLLEKTDRNGVGGLAVVTGLTPILPTPGSKLAVGDENSAKLKSLIQLLEALSARGMMDQVDSVDLSQSSEIAMGYGGRFTVELPMLAEDFDQRTRWLEATLAQLAENESGTIDLTGDDAVRVIPN